MSRGELPSSPGAEKPCALLQQQGAAFLVVRTSRGACAEQRQRRLLRPGPWASVAFNLVQHGAGRVFFAHRAPGGHENHSVPRCRKRCQRGVGHHREWQVPPAHLGAHA